VLRQGIDRATTPAVRDWLRGLLDHGECAVLDGGGTAADQRAAAKADAQR
jgi:hypothetical protein